MYVVKMVDLVSLLSTVLPIVASGLLVLVIFLNILIKIRRKFRISVNCWFCNSWTKVPYDDHNSFNCPTCMQYNGFTKDGDYNKIIPEQHDELMNRSQHVKTVKSVASNGLCVFCNNNQQLKIFQLASFTPLVEENYDIEIEHFQEQLDKAYKLCKKCDRVLKKTLNKQNAWIFGTRIKKMCCSGISKVTEQIKKETRMTFSAKLDDFVSVVLVCAVIFTSISSIKMFTRTLSMYIPAAYLPIYESAIAGLNRSQIVDFHFHPYFTKSVKIQPYSAICGVGLIFQVFKMLRGHIWGSTKVDNLMCWIILFLISWVRFSKDLSLWILFIEPFCCVYLLATAFTQPTKHQPKPTRTKSMRNLAGNTCTDIHEWSDFENISSSSKNCSSLIDSYDSRNRSVYSSSLSMPQHNSAGNLCNSSFISARSLLNDVDIYNSLSNLHLEELPFRPAPRYRLLQRPKPVLSPPKLPTVNSWVAGGFWKNSDGVLMPFGQTMNLSRSSSESSGFGSQNQEFVPMGSNFVGEFDRLSLNGGLARVSPTSLGFAAPETRNNLYFYHNHMHGIGSPGFRFNEPYHQRVENWSDRINLRAMQSFHH